MLAAVALTLVLNVVAGLIAARMYRLGREAAVNIGLTVLARGEFALILASYAAAAGLDARITPFVAGYVLVLAMGAPILAKRSAWFAEHARLRRRPARMRRVPARCLQPERDRHLLEVPGGSPARQLIALGPTAEQLQVVLHREPHRAVHLVGAGEDAGDHVAR